MDATSPTAARVVIPTLEGPQLDHELWVAPEETAEFLTPGMGTETMALVLHSLVRFSRWSYVLELGAGYTTMTLLRALRLNRQDHAREAASVAAADDVARAMLHAPYYMGDEGSQHAAPGLLHIVDNFGEESPERQRLTDAIARGGYGEHVRISAEDLVSFSRNREQRLGGRKVDLLWFDAKQPNYGAPEAIRDYWDHLSDNGAIVVHFTAGIHGGVPWYVLTHSDVAGIVGDPDVEVLTLVEPHKVRQGSFTIVRKSAAQGRFHADLLEASLHAAPVDGDLTQVDHAQFVTTIANTVLRWDADSSAVATEQLLEFCATAITRHSYSVDDGGSRLQEAVGAVRACLRMCRERIANPAAEDLADPFQVGVLEKAVAFVLELLGDSMGTAVNEKYVDVALRRAEDALALGQATPELVLNALRAEVHDMVTLAKENMNTPEIRDLQRRVVAVGAYANIWQMPYPVYVTPLRSTPFIPPFMIPLTEDLEAHFEEIRDEILSVLPASGLAENLDANWDSLSLAQEGFTWQDIHVGPRTARQRRLFPRTTAVIDAMERKYGLDMWHEPDKPTVRFSVLDPHAHIVPHHGPTNSKARIHLALKVPTGAYIRVANEIRTWEEGKCLVIDDSYEHEVWNWSDERRVVLLMDTWHPSLTDGGREEVKRFMRRFYDQEAARNPLVVVTAKSLPTQATRKRERERAAGARP